MEKINQKILERYVKNLLWGGLAALVFKVTGVISSSFEVAVIVMLTAILFRSEQIARKMEIRR